jgi:hypothetical protein
MGSRPVAGRPRPRFLGLADVDFILGLACSKAAIGTPTGADGQSGAPFILMPSGAPLAHKSFVSLPTSNRGSSSAPTRFKAFIYLKG